ncbi:unnamed protein product, partial [Anisakis simplex]|uniref:Integrator complex subunit 4 n=1 Tax=Anisakis simplex TaxID=6269 RepID=A0A0M3KDY2_ANISI
MFLKKLLRQNQVNSLLLTLQTLNEHFANHELCDDIKLIVRNIIEEERFHSWDLSEYLARLLAMKVKLSDSTDLRWILQCARRESLELKRIALQGFRIACDRAEVLSSREVLKIGAMLLQDEETAVREESASILCEFITENVRRHQNDTNDETTGAPKTPSPIVHLNAQIVSWMLHDKIPNLHDAICEHF